MVQGMRANGFDGSQRRDRSGRFVSQGKAVIPGGTAAALAAAHSDGVVEEKGDVAQIVRDNMGSFGANRANLRNAFRAVSSVPAPLLSDSTIRDWSSPPPAPAGFPSLALDTRGAGL
jgi:hypothetical protein